MIEETLQKYGIAGVCILLTLSILVRVGEFLWKLRQKKESSIEDSIKLLTKAVQENSEQLEKHALALNDFPKFRIDVRRFYAAIKQLSGDKWPAIRDEILKDDFTL